MWISIYRNDKGGRADASKSGDFIVSTNSAAVHIYFDLRKNLFINCATLRGGKCNTYTNKKGVAMEKQQNRFVKMMKGLLKTFTKLEWSMILAIITFSVYFFIIGEDAWQYRLLDLLVAVCGVVSVVLCAKGKISQYYFGVLNVAGYAFLGFHNAYYGEFMLNAFYYLPTNLIGLYLWRKHRESKKSDVVVAKKMIWQKFLVVDVMCALAIAGYAWTLSFFGNAAPWLDSTTNVLSIIAMVLMIARYREQWALWIIVDIVTVIMWILAGDPTMIAMWSIFLVNAIHGWLVWNKLALKNEIAG
jgi:nicotinamide mononucleotide transporter